MQLILFSFFSAALLILVALTTNGIQAEEIRFERASVEPHLSHAILAAGDIYRFQPGFSLRAVTGANSPDTYAPSVDGLVLNWHTGLAGLRLSGGVFYAAQPRATPSNIAAFPTEAAASIPITSNTASLEPQSSNLATSLSFTYDRALPQGWVLSVEAGAVFEAETLRFGPSWGPPPHPNHGSSRHMMPPPAYPPLRGEISELETQPYLSVTLGLRF